MIDNLASRLRLTMSDSPLITAIYVKLSELCLIEATAGHSSYTLTRLTNFLAPYDIPLMNQRPTLEKLKIRFENEGVTFRYEPNNFIQLVWHKTL
jgi:hypothetical protein